MVGIVDLVDGKLCNEHLFLTKVKCLLSSLFIFFGTHLNHPHFFPTHKPRRKVASSNSESYGTQCENVGFINNNKMFARETHPMLWHMGGGVPCISDT
jgi:hypothetical protein